MKTSSTLGFLVILAMTGFSQSNFNTVDPSTNKTDSLPQISYDFSTISFNQGYWFKKYYVDGKEISSFEASRIIISCDSSRKLYSLGSGLLVFGTILRVAGGLTICITNFNTLSNSINGQWHGPNYIGLGAGISLELLSLIFSTNGENIYSKAFTVFNDVCLPQLKKKS
jgi:hypothetical protein